MEHLVLLHPEVTTDFGARKISQALLAMQNFVATLSVISVREVGVRFCVSIAAVSD
jgi:hypothetical protein